MGYHGDFRIDGDVFREVFAMIAEAGATLVLDIGSPGMPSFQPEAVAEIAQRHPKMKILVCHLLAPVLGDYKILEEGLRVLALHNVSFGAGCQCRGMWRLRHIRTLQDRALWNLPGRLWGLRNLYGERMSPVL